MPQVPILVLAGILSAGYAGAQPTTAVLRPRPLASPQEAANLESHVLQNPEDLEARKELLQYYLDIAPLPPMDNPGRRSLRLQQVLYLVEHHPEAAVSGSRVAYVYRSTGPNGGPYANVSDHEVVRDQWLAAVQGHPKNNAVTLNAVKFLEVEDPGDAEQVLRRALDADPENREIAANLGFLYATQIRAGHATPQLDQSSNAIVLAAAGTALANLAKDFDAVNGTMLDLAGKLLTRARELAPDDVDIQGPMPLIKYFQNSHR